MQNRKIVFFINSLYSGGAEKVLSTIITELSNQNYDIELISVERHDFYTIPKEVKRTYLSTLDVKYGSMIKLLYLPIWAWKLRQYIKKNHIKLVQSHLYRANYINILAKLFGAGHTAQIVNTGAISRYLEGGLSGKINLKIIKYLYPKADLIITKSKGMQLDMQKLFNFKNSQLVINNPFDIKKIEKMAQEEVEDGFKFREDRRYLIHIGRFDTFKRQDLIIEALASLDSSIELILIGDGKKLEDTKRLVNDLKLDSRVHFIGRVKNPYSYISKSNLLILSSTNGEGFPNVLVEGMICKTAVISSDCISGPREILAPNSDIEFQLKDKIEITPYGILFPIKNKKLLLHSIIYSLSKKDTKIIGRAYKRACEFSLEKITNNYKNSLKKGTKNGKNGKKSNCYSS